MKLAMAWTAAFWSSSMLFAMQFNQLRFSCLVVGALFGVGACPLILRQVNNV